MTAVRVLVCLAALALVGSVRGVVLAQTPVPTNLPVPLFPEFDQFGNQFEVVQAYETSTGEQSITAGLLDTGASVVTFSYFDQEFLFDLQGYPSIPTIPGAVATADAIGGSLVGDVSVPGKILTAGASALTIDFDTPAFSYDLSNAASIGGIQAFVGTFSGSPNLPSIVGTPINVPSPTNPAGLATVLDQTGYSFDLGEIDPAFAGINYEFPDVSFVAPGTSLVPTSNTYEAVNIPLTLLGIDNTGNPGNDISAAPNPFQNNTAVAFTPSASGSATNSLLDLSCLFDTGAQLTIISPIVAAALGLTDLDGNPIETPFDVIDVQGAGDIVESLPGYILDSLTLPRTDGGTVDFTDVPVYVLDVGFGIDGILGMNLFNAADSFIYDPYNLDGPQMSALFLTDRLDSLIEDAALFDDLDADAALALLGSRYGTVNPLFPGLHQVPEPSTLLLGLFGLGSLALYLRRRAIKRGHLAGEVGQVSH